MPFLPSSYSAVGRRHRPGLLRRHGVHLLHRVPAGHKRRAPCDWATCRARARASHDDLLRAGIRWFVRWYRLAVAAVVGRVGGASARADAPSAPLVVKGVGGGGRVGSAREHKVNRLGEGRPVRLRESGLGRGGDHEGAAGTRRGGGHVGR